MVGPASLIIFDCDGVLVDSESIGNRVLAEVVTELGFAMTPEEAFARFHGGHLTGVLSFIRERLGIETTDALRISIRNRIDEALAREVEEVPGATALLDLLDEAGIAYVAGSNGPPEKMRVTLGRTGLLERMHGRIFSAWDIGVFKPDPAIFLHAAERMGVPIGACAVVEDSLSGVQAGVASGARCHARTAYLDRGTIAALGAEPFDDLLELAGVWGLARA